MKRRGFTFLEIFLAVLLLGTLTAVCLKFFAATNDQRREQFAQLAATQEAANVMERLVAVAWDDLPKQNGDGFQLSAQARRVLPEPRIEVKVAGTLQVPSAKVAGTLRVPSAKVLVTVFWRPQLGGPERQVHLVAWRFEKP